MAVGRKLLQEGQYFAAEDAFRAVLQLDATQPEALRLMTKAQQQLEAQQAKARQAKEHQREAALDIAIRFAQEKSQERARQDARAQEQIARARDQKVKFFYTRGLTAYRQGDFKEAVDNWQQMALVDPQHPLVRDAQRLITRAETKQAEDRARLAMRNSSGGSPALVSELEQQLTARRIEIETVIKYAKLAINDRRYDTAIQLLEKVLVQDPSHAQAQALLNQAQMAKLQDDEKRLVKSVERDEHSMVNDVLKAQVIPQAKPVALVAPAPKSFAESPVSAALRQPISLDFSDVPLADVLQFIADSASISIIPSPQLDLKSRRVSLKVTDLPLETALKYLVKNQSLSYRVEHDAVLIASAEEFLNEPLQTRVLFLRNGLGPFALEASAVEPNPALSMESIKGLIERTVPQAPNSKVVIDERSGALIVTNTAEHLSQIEQLLSQLDITPVQVLIEARFIEVAMNDLHQLGLESVLNGDFALDKKGDSRDRGATQGPGSAITNGSGIKFPALSRENEGANFTLQGVLTGTQFESVLHLLEESKKTKTLSAPRVTALNNKTAQIRVADEFNYPTRYEVSLIQFDINGDGDFNDAGETEFANVPQDFKKRDIGILLNVTPSVGKDARTITLVLAPEVSQFSQFRDLGGGVTVPEFTSSQLTTSVVIQDGQTVMLGGLMKDVTTDDVSKVPFFGDLPVVGNLFRQKEATSNRRNLLIFITARLLAPRGPVT